MVRTRIPEASLVGLLAALATFCALEARGGQPYSIVGQSSPATAATGRRPLAERIKAANRPIRIAAEEALAPDHGLIPALDDPNTVERQWIPGPAVVEFPAGGPEAIAVDEAIAPEEPGVMPPPESTAIAAHPTTGDDAGLVGEVSTTEAEADAPSAEAEGSTGEPTDQATPAAEGSAAPPDRLPAETAARAPAARVTPPRRTTARVTPQRREALLDRLRSALAEVPRPLGLIPAPPRQQAGGRRPQAASRSAVARHPVPAASLPQPLTALSATTPTDATLTADSLVPADSLADAPSSTVDLANDDADSASHLADDGVTTEPTAAQEATTDLATEATTADASDSLVETAAPGPADDATDTTAAPTTGEPEAISEVEAAGDPVALLDAPTLTSTATLPSADPATLPAADLTTTPTPQQPRATSPQGKRQSGSQRARAFSSHHQPMTPLDRLQARLEQMPRALGLVPAPRPSMHATQAPRRRTAAPAPASKSEAVVTAPAPAAPTEPTTPTADVMVATDEPGATSEPLATIEGEVVLDPPELDLPELDATELDSVEADGSLGNKNSAETAATTSDAPAPATEIEIEQEHLAVVDGEGEPTTSPTPASDDESVEGEKIDAVGSSASAEAPALVNTTPPESVMPATSPAPERPRGVVAKRPASGHHARQPAAPVVRRPIRDALGSALANMPRPFGLLPEPESTPQRRPAAGPAHGTAAPRALTTKSIGTRPLDGSAESQPDIARATVAVPPAAAPSGDDSTTLTSGNDAEEAQTPTELSDSGSEPATLDTDLQEGASGPGALQASPASVEVTVDCPEESTTLGERVTLHLTIRNPGTTAVNSVTPVVHFGAGLEPLGIRGRNGHFSADGSVTFDRLAELPAGECVELEIIAVCTGTGTIPFRGVAWCGDGDDREIVPADASVTVIEAVAAQPTGVRHR